MEAAVRPNDRIVLAAGGVSILLGLQRMWLHPEQQIKNYLFMGLGVIIIAQRIWIMRRGRDHA